MLGKLVRRLFHMEHTEIRDVLGNHTQKTDIVNIIPSKLFLEIIITFIAFTVLFISSAIHEL
jgi:hypothetical protein